jgi:hypothetical protein
MQCGADVQARSSTQCRWVCGSCLAAEAPANASEKRLAQAARWPGASLRPPLPPFSHSTPSVYGARFIGSVHMLSWLWAQWRRPVFMMSIVFLLLWGLSAALFAMHAVALASAAQVQSITRHRAGRGGGAAATGRHPHRLMSKPALAVAAPLLLCCRRRAWKACRRRTSIAASSAGVVTGTSARCRSARRCSSGAERRLAACAAPPRDVESPLVPRLLCAGMK